MPNRRRNFLLNPIRHRLCGTDVTLNYAFDHLHTHFATVSELMERLYATAGAAYQDEVDRSLSSGINAYARILLDGETAHWPYQRLMRFMQGVDAQLRIELPILCCVDYVAIGTLPGVGIEPSLIPKSLQNVIMEFYSHGKISDDNQHSLALALSS